METTDISLVGTPLRPSCEFTAHDSHGKPITEPSFAISASWPLIHINVITRHLLNGSITKRGERGEI